MCWGTLVAAKFKSEFLAGYNWNWICGKHCKKVIMHMRLFGNYDGYACYFDVTIRKIMMIKSYTFL